MAPKLVILTDNCARDLHCVADLKARDAARFDYIDISADGFVLRLVKYRGSWYDIDDMCSTRELPAYGGLGELRRWTAYVSDTYFSGIVFRWADDDCESVIVGRYYVAASEEE